MPDAAGEQLQSLVLDEMEVRWPEADEEQEIQSETRQKHYTTVML